MELLSGNISEAYTYTYFFKDDSLYVKYFTVDRELIINKIIPNKRLGNISEETIKEILDKTLDLNVFPNLNIISKATVYTLNNDYDFIEILYFDKNGRFIMSKRITSPNRGLLPRDEEKIKMSLDPDEPRTFIPAYIVMSQDTVIGKKALLFSDLDQIIRIVPIRDYSLNGLIKCIHLGKYDVDTTRIGTIRISRPEEDVSCIIS